MRNRFWGKINIFMERRIFIHHDGALGDVLLSLPALELIRRGSSYIHMTGRADIMDLLRRAGVIDAATASDSALFVSLYTDASDERARNFLSGFAGAFVFTVNSDSVIAHAVADTIPDTRIILTVPPEGTRMHVSGFRLGQLAGERRVTDLHAVPRLAIPGGAQEKARQFLYERGYRSGIPLAALHPGSGGKRKCWPLERFFRLADRLEKGSDLFVLIISGPAEYDAERRKIDDFVSSRKGIVHVCGEELIVVAALLSMCSLYAGNDSGITHLAAAAYAEKVVVLFGPTDPGLWKPHGRNVTVIAPDIGCAPCAPGFAGNLSGEAPRCGGRCLAGLSVEKVCEKIKSWEYTFTS